MKHVPNFITTLNLAAGFAAIISAANGSILTACWLIAAAMIFDFLDGFSSRLLKAYSETGRELDSLADVVSFGVAPALIIYELLAPAISNLQRDGSGQGTIFPGLLLYIPVLMPVCAGLRLAKFNIDTTQTEYFKGLPTPANAIAVISIVMAANYSSVTFLKSFTDSTAAMLVYTVVLSLLMVTRLPLISLKFKSLSFKGNERRYILIGLVLVLFAIFGIAAVPLIIPLYLLVSLIPIIFRTKVL